MTARSESVSVRAFIRISGNGDCGNLGLVDELLVTCSVGQCHAVLIVAADYAFELDAAY